MSVIINGLFDANKSKTSVTVADKDILTSNNAAILTSITRSGTTGVAGNITGFNNITGTRNGSISGFQSVTGTNAGSITGFKSVTGTNGGSITGFTTVSNAVWNDLADAIQIPEGIILEPGRCYNLAYNNCKLTEKLGELGILGIHSDTYGFLMGEKDCNCIKLALAGFVLAYVDDVYVPGTPLTCTHDGMLTGATSDLIMRNPASLVGYYYKEEPNEEWNGVKVNGRHWIKVK